MFVCSSFLISVCMFIVLKASLISSATVIVCAGGAIWLEVLYWIDHVWSSIECVCCACGPSERLDVPSICLFVFLYVGSYLLI